MFDSAGPVCLQELLLRRLERRLVEDGLASTSSDEVLASLRAVLSEPLSEAERRAIEDSGAADPLTRLDRAIASRIERALCTTLARARGGGRADAGEPRVCVVRDPRSPIDLGAPGDLLVLAGSLVFERLRADARFAPGSADGALTSWTPRGSVEVHDLSLIVHDLDQRLDAREVAAPAPRRQPAEGELLGGKYRLGRRIGQGGFGEVYEARDESLGHKVAIKVLSTAHSSHGDLVAFRNEARRLTRLKHRNIVEWKVFEEAEDGFCFFVMELLEGESVEQILEREKQLSWKRVARICIQVVDALRAAHDLAPGESILHLDLKPRNVFIQPPGGGRQDERAVVIDFGIGQYLGGEEELVEPTEARGGEDDLGATGTRDLGLRGSPQGVQLSYACTPEYASPEQCAHLTPGARVVPLDGRSDVYSLGVMAFKMLTGELPFERPSNRRELLRIHREQAPRSVRSLAKRVPRALAAFVDRCLERDRDRRWRSADEAYRALQRILHPPAWRQALPAVLACAVTLACVLVLLWPEPPEPPFELYYALDPHGGRERHVQSEGLYLGPGIDALELRATSARARPGVSSLRLVERPDPRAAALPGWELEWTPLGLVRIAAPKLEGSLRRTVHLELDARVYSRPFELVYLGSDAWWIEGALVRGLRGRALDPEDQHLSVWVAGAAVDGIASVRANVAGEAYALVASQNVTRADAVQYELGLDTLELPEGRVDLRVEAIDRAGRSESRWVALDVVRAPLAIASIALDAPRERAGYRVDSARPSVLSLSLGRRASLSWRVEDESGAALHEGVEDGAAQYAIELGRLGGQRPGPWSGRVVVRATDDAFVARTPRSTRGSASAAIAFRCAP